MKLPTIDLIPTRRGSVYARLVWCYPSEPCGPVERVTRYTRECGTVSELLLVLEVALTLDDAPPPLRVLRDKPPATR